MIFAILHPPYKTVISAVVALLFCPLCVLDDANVPPEGACGGGVGSARATDALGYVLPTTSYIEITTLRVTTS